jgi:integrase
MIASTTDEKRYTFSDLVSEWKPFHYLKLEPSSQQFYDKILPRLALLNRYNVDEINAGVIDGLIKYWVTDYPKSKQRLTFEKELTILKVILNFYRSRKNQNYAIPILDEHYAASDFTKKAKKPVQALSQEELGMFLEALRMSANPQNYSLALTQFCLGLRVGEVCGLAWEHIDLKHRIVQIAQTISWDTDSWEPRVKERPKNGRVRVLVLPEILVEELEKMKATRDTNVSFVFHRAGKPLRRIAIARAYNRILQGLGIRHVSGTHMLRKTSATQANEVTGDFHAVSKLLGHSSVNVTMKYVAQTSLQKQKVADALNSVARGALASGVVPQCPAPKEFPKLMLVKSTG